MAGLSSSRSTCRSPGACRKASANSRISTSRSSYGRFSNIFAQPPLELAYGEDTEDQLPLVVGGLSVALARAFKIIDGNLKNPATERWQQCFRIFDLLM